MYIDSDGGLLLSRLPLIYFNSSNAQRGTFLVNTTIVNIVNMTGRAFLNWTSCLGRFVGFCVLYCSFVGVFLFFFFFCFE